VPPGEPAGPAEGLSRRTIGESTKADALALLGEGVVVDYGLAPAPPLLLLPLEPDGDGEVGLFFGWVDPAVPPAPADPLPLELPLADVPPLPASPAGRSQPARSALESASASTRESFCFMVSLLSGTWGCNKRAGISPTGAIG
jgi:hypothetical protein